MHPIWERYSNSRFCPHCGYDLAGHVDHKRFVCPECGLKTARWALTSPRRRGRRRRFVDNLWPEGPAVAVALFALAIALLLAAH